MSTAFEKYQELIVDLLDKNTDDIKQLKKDINQEIAEMKKDINQELTDIRGEITKINGAKPLIKEHVEWKKDVTEVWSPTQMAQSKKQVYAQKYKWAVGYGVFIAAQVAWILYTYFNNQPPK